MKEIEKKFLVKSVPEDLEKYKSIEIEQAYLTISKQMPILRIRKYDNEFVLTYKFRLKSNENVSMCREEELPLNKEAYDHLKTKIDGNVIEKTRYIIPLENNLKAELDIFKGYLEGLIVVEVEFKDEKDVSKFIVPSWFGKDITSDVRYKNACLTKINNISEL